MTVSPSTTKPPLHVLRGILRHLKIELPKELAKKASSPSTASNNARTFVLEQYRASQHITSPTQIIQLRQMAIDYLALRNDLSERAKLYELDTGAEVKLSPKEMSRRAAARAGLQLPDLNPKLD